jgi:hypothetical protein
MPRIAWRDAARIGYLRLPGREPGAWLSGWKCDRLGIPCWYQTAPHPPGSRGRTLAKSPNRRSRWFPAEIAG